MSSINNNTVSNEDTVYPIITDPIREQQLLRELNSRLRTVLSSEQECNSELKKSLVEHQTKAAETFQQTKRIEAELDSTYDNLVIAKTAAEEHKEIVIPCAQSSAARQTESIDAQESLIAGLEQLVQQKLDTIKRYEEEIKKLSIENIQLETDTEEALKRVEKNKNELKGMLLSCAKKEIENEKLQTRLDISLFKNQTLKGKFDGYGEQGVDQYAKKASAEAITSVTASLETRYKAMLEIQKKKHNEECKRELHEKEQENKILEDKLAKVTKETDMLQQQVDEQILENTQQKEKLDALINEADQLEHDLEKKRDEFEAAFVLQTNHTRELASLEEKIDTSQQNQLTMEKELQEINRDHEALLQEYNQRSIVREIQQVKANLENVRTRLKDANIRLDNEINKYKGLVEVAEKVIISPRPAKKRRST